MHEAVVVANVPALLLTLVIVVLVSWGLIHQVRIRAARQIELRRLQQILAAESEREEKIAEQEYTSSMLAAPRNSAAAATSLSSSSSSSSSARLRTAAASTVAATATNTDTNTNTSTNTLCAVCGTATNRRCSRCKSINYCSAKCQFTHWRDGHKSECRQVNKPDKPESVAEAPPAISLAVEATKKLQSTEAPPSRAHVISPKPVPAQVEIVKRTSVQTSESKPSEESSVASDGTLVKPKKILFPYGRFARYFNWDFRKPPCGLINCGNSCFANVILQCLSYTRPLAAYLLEGSHRAECRRNDWCFLCELQDHASRVFNSEVPFSPFRILSRLRDIGNHLGYGRQEDAHEFMRFAVDSMQSICLDQFGGEKQVDSRSQETTLIQYIFGGHLQSQVKCMNCGHESNRYENMMDLAVEIQGAVESLEDGLAQFTAPEWLDGENKYKCDRCNAYVKASKHLTIHDAPNILTIALKRFQSGKFGKLNKRVTFPEALDMQPYMSGKGDRPPLYRLYAVVVHVDMLNASFFGHYICYVRDMSGTWYKVDDSKVKEVDAEKVMSQKAYMLMYTRSSPRSSPDSTAASATSSLTDVSVSNGRTCSSSSCKYQQSWSIGQVHPDLHQVSPIIAGTLVDSSSLIEESVGPSYSTLQASTLEKVIELGFDDSDSTTASSQETERAKPTLEVVESDATSPDPVPERRTAKRRLVESSELQRTRSSSCPPTAKTPASPSAHQHADDLPRSFGYSLCQRDRVRLAAAEEVESPSKRQHLLRASSSAMDLDNLNNDEVVELIEDEPVRLIEELDQSSNLQPEELEILPGMIEEDSKPVLLSSSDDDRKEDSKRRVVNGMVLKPIFAKGFLDRSPRRVLSSGDIKKVSDDGDGPSQPSQEQVKLEKTVVNSSSSSNSNSNSGRALGRSESCSCGSDRNWKKCCGMLKEIESNGRRLVA